MGEQEHVYDEYAIECTCKVQWYIIFILNISLLGIIQFAISNARKFILLKAIYFLIYII